MADKYQSLFQQYLDEVDHYLKLKDDESWRMSCHKIKSAAASLGLTAVFALSGELEVTELPPTEIYKMLGELEDTNRLAVAQLKAWLDQQ